MILVRFVRRSPPSITAAHLPLHCSIPSPAAPGDAPGREPALPETIILVQIHINMLRPQAAAIHPSPPSTTPSKTSTFLSPQPQTRRVCAGSGSGAEHPPLPRPAALTRPPALPVLCLSLELSACPWSPRAVPGCPRTCPQPGMAAAAPHRPRCRGGAGAARKPQPGGEGKRQSRGVPGRAGRVPGRVIGAPGRAVGVPGGSRRAPGRARPRSPLVRPRPGEPGWGCGPGRTRGKNAEFV